MQRLRFALGSVVMVLGTSCGAVVATVGALPDDVGSEGEGEAAEGEGETAEGEGETAEGEGEAGEGEGETGEGEGEGELESREAYCAGGGPPLVSTGTSTVCTGDLARDVFRFALCSCASMSGNGAVVTEGFDSLQGTSLESGAAIGINADWQVNAPVEVGGSFIVGADLKPNDDTIVDGDLLVGDEALFFGHAIDVAGDARIGGRVAGDRLTAASITTESTDVAVGTITGERATSVVDVAAPCECDANVLLDVPTLVAAAATRNDNVDVGLDSGALSNFSDGATLSLPCGRFHLDHLQGTGTVTLTVDGRVALFIGGDVNVGTLVVNLAAGAEVDVFIAGSLTAANGVSLGDASAPRRARLYVGGNTLNLQGTAEVLGNIYAPAANATTGGGGLTVTGALFVGSLNPNGPLTIHYDAAILSADEGCFEGVDEPVATTCDSCTDCDHACIDGACGACRTSADCCAPLQCSDTGTCIPRTLF